jgi:soluble lytic murein transglycosylase-like protein
MTQVAALLLFFFIFSSIGGNSSSSSAINNRILDSHTTVLSTNDQALFQESAITYQPCDKEKIKSFIAVYNTKLSKEDIDTIVDAVDDESQKKDIDPTIIFALIARESGYNPKAESKTGAKGLGQLKSFHYATLGITDPFNCEQNARGVVRHISELLDKWKNERHNQLALALASYNDGYGKVYRDGGKIDSDTMIYVKDILKTRKQLS